MLLDETQQLIVEYNVAMGNAMNPAVDVLARHRRKPVLDWMKSVSFQDWDIRSSGSQQFQPDQFHKWNSNLKTLTIISASSSSDMFIEMVKIWLGFHKGFGWLVADEKEKAIASIREGYTSYEGGEPPI